MQKDRLTAVITRNRTKSRTSGNACMRCEISRATTTRTFKRTGNWRLCESCAGAVDLWHANQAVKEAEAVKPCIELGSHLPYPTDEHITGELCAVCGLPEKAASTLAPETEWGEVDAANNPRRRKKPV